MKTLIIALSWLKNAPYYLYDDRLFAAKVGWTLDKDPLGSSTISLTALVKINTTN